MTTQEAISVVWRNLPRAKEVGLAALVVVILAPVLMAQFVYGILCGMYNVAYGERS